jgi:hypothetical protein
MLAQIDKNNGEPNMEKEMITSKTFFTHYQNQNKRQE